MCMFGAGVPMLLKASRSFRKKRKGGFSGILPFLLVFSRNFSWLFWEFYYCPAVPVLAWEVPVALGTLR